MSSLRTATATLCSVSAHVGVAVLVFNMGGVFGQTSAPSESISVNIVHTLVLDAITDTVSEEPPAASAAQTASTQSEGPPDETVPAPQPPDVARLKREAEEAAAAEHKLLEAEEARKAAEAARRAEAERKLTEAQAVEEARQRAEAEALDAARRAEETRLAEEFRQMEKERQEATAHEAEAREAEAAKLRAEAQRKDAERKEAERKEAEVKRDKLGEARRIEERRKEEAKRKKAAAAKESRAASVASSGKESAKAGKGRTSASRGDVFAYAALVRARVAANRPSGSGLNGTVVVSFGVSGSGGITHVSIARSSGSAALDSAARSAVRNAGPFPPPPDGAGRSFSVPFHFQ